MRRYLNIGPRHRTHATSCQIQRPLPVAHHPHTDDVLRRCALTAAVREYCRHTHVRAEYAGATAPIHLDHPVLSEDGPARIRRADYGWLAQFSVRHCETQLVRLPETLGGLVTDQRARWNVGSRNVCRDGDPDKRWRWRYDGGCLPPAKIVDTLGVGRGETSVTLPAVGVGSGITTPTGLGTVACGRDAEPPQAVRKAIRMTTGIRGIRSPFASRSQFMDCACTDNRDAVARIL